MTKQDITLKNTTTQNFKRIDNNFSALYNFANNSDVTVNGTSIVDSTGVAKLETCTNSDIDNLF